MKLRLKGQMNVFEEIAGQYKKYILLGVLKEGEKLPSCRELAIELGINPNTVERAYSLLEAQDLVIKMPKKGVYVSKIQSEKADLFCEAEKQIIAIKDVGITKEEILKIIEAVYAEGKK